MTLHGLEVDLNYPEELHDLHSDYPLALESCTITKEMVSSFSNTTGKFNLNIAKHLIETGAD